MISGVELAQLLGSYPVLRALPPPLAQRLPHDAQHLVAGRGQMIFDVGGPCQSFVALTAGSMRVIKPGSDGHEILLYRLQPGESCILTTSCLLGRARFPARGVAESGLAGFSLSQTFFVELVEQSAAFRTFTFASFAERMTRLTELIEEVAFRRLDRRLAALLLARGTAIHMTHQLLADELGSTREAISRTLEEFEAHGLVKLERGHIHVLNPGALQQIVGAR